MPFNILPFKNVTSLTLLFYVFFLYGCSSSYPEDPHALYTPPVVNDLPEPSAEDLEIKSETHSSTKHGTTTGSNSMHVNHI